MFTLKNVRSKIAAGMTGVGMLAAMMMTTPAASAALFGGNNDLGDLFVLDSLFADSSGIFSGGQRTVIVVSGDTLSAIAARELGDASRFPEIAAANSIANPNLIFPGQVLVIPAGTGTGTANNLGDLFILDRLFSNDTGVLDSGNTDLGDLFLLDRLFGNGNGVLNGTGGTNNLGDLIILDKLFNNDSILDNGGVFGNGTDLGDMIILDKLFGNGNGLFNGTNGTTNLGDLIILDQLFN